MSITKNDVFDRAMNLDEADRVTLAGLLLSPINDIRDDGWEAAWEAEIRRRAAELDAGSVASIPWEVIRERITQKLDAETRR
ncbi:MAG TPA: addiction module protein [Candidatus Hydrogenedentes bacterium]|nr:addiction module protein [Candidatus Hydrogenedentota bacterium]HRK35501.1 addiction module protein [Candidatus Hydrogenedentota bacterium]